MSTTDFSYRLSEILISWSTTFEWLFVVYPFWIVISQWLMVTYQTNTLAIYHDYNFWVMIIIIGCAWILESLGFTVCKSSRALSVPLARPPARNPLSLPSCPTPTTQIHGRMYCMVIIVGDCGNYLAFFVANFSSLKHSLPGQKWLEKWRETFDYIWLQIHFCGWI